MSDRPRITEDFKRLVGRYWARVGPGGPLHCWLEDGNSELHHVQSGLQAAREANDTEAIEIAEAAAKMTGTQRGKIANSAYDWARKYGRAQGHDAQE